MFWDKAYQPSHNIEALLEKENVTVEEFLEEEDILQECKSQRKALVNYFTRPDVIKRLIELITTEPDENLPTAQRFRHANMACEVLTVGLPSLDEKLLADAESLNLLYSYLEKEPPLNPLLSSFFSKTFSMLFTKKTEQDWFLYQKMCLQFLEYIKSQKNFLELVCKHFNTPVIPDLITQMMSDVEGGQLKRNLYEWLTEDKLVERLIGILDNADACDMHVNVAEFLCDLIQQGRTMRTMSEQENDSFEPAFEGSNPILKTIESEATIEALLNVILKTNAPESAIVSGISVVLKLIKPVVFVEEPTSNRMIMIHNCEKEIHEQIINTVIPVIAPRLGDFNNILKTPPNRSDITTTAGCLSPPFGQTRLQVCRIFAMLLQTRNPQISKAICETDFFETLLDLFKRYCWNNFLHSEVEKCLQLIFNSQSASDNNNLATGVRGVDMELDIFINSVMNTFQNIIDEPSSEQMVNPFDAVANDKPDNSVGDTSSQSNATDDAKLAANATESPVEKPESPTNNDEATNNSNVATAEISKPAKDFDAVETNNDQESAENTEAAASVESSCNDKLSKDATAEVEQFEEASPRKEDDKVSDEAIKVPMDAAPTVLQTHVIVKCKLISKLIDCWKHNNEIQSAENGRRLGYMGHLIKIFKHITSCISESEHIGALIENNLADATEVELWQSIVNPNDGEYTKAIEEQSKVLAANATEYSDLAEVKNIISDNCMWDLIMSDPNMDASGNMMALADEDDDDEDNATGDQSRAIGQSLYGKSCISLSSLQAFGNASSPWDSMDPFYDSSRVNSNLAAWATDFNADNFADFDSNFSSFTNDMGESLDAVAKQSCSDITARENNDENESKEEYDNNANVEKSINSLNKEEMAQRFADNLAKFENNDQNSFNEKAGAQLVRALHTVMNDSEDDYEDDEGMWTKPLGSSATVNLQSSDDDNEKVNEATTTSNDKDVPAQNNSITNGPSKDNLDNLELTNREHKSSLEAHDAAAELKAASSTTAILASATTTESTT